MTCSVLGHEDNASVLSAETDILMLEDAVCSLNPWGSGPVDPYFLFFLDLL